MQNGRGITEPKKDTLEILIRFSNIGANQLEDVSTLGSTGATTTNLFSLKTSQDSLKRKYHLANCTDFCASTYTY